LKTIIKLLVAAVVLHAAWRVGSAFLTYYRFEDRLQEAAQFGGSRPAAEVREQAVKVAKELNVPIDPEAIFVRKTDREIFIDANYVDQLQVFPGYDYPWEFKLTVKAWTRAW
jgi:hypothetical protein